MDILVPIGYSSSSCGYCHSSNTSRSYGLWAHALSPQSYHALIDRGWRRSGSYLYKPDLARTCCKQYTIRLSVSQFRPSKSQRQLLNKFVRLVHKHHDVQPKNNKDNSPYDLSSVISNALGPESSLTTPQSASSAFSLELEPASFTREKFQLFDLYQQRIHHDAPNENTPRSFTRFLCDGPLPTDSHSPSYSGQYHHLYRLDGKLIGFGVIDILPNALSSVYLVWHPDYAHLSIGKLSALIEIALALELKLEYYYMGYYIDTCQKMRYKADYKPSDLLHPYNNEFIPLQDALKVELNVPQDENMNVSEDEKSIDDEVDARRLPLSLPPGCTAVSDNTLSEQLIYYENNPVPLINTHFWLQKTDQDKQYCAKLRDALACVGTNHAAKRLWILQ